METLEEKIKRVLKDKIELEEYNKEWPVHFEIEKNFLFKEFKGLIVRIEHFGSTSVNGLISKPVIDMLCEITSVKEADRIVPVILEPLGYDYFLRPSFGDNDGPFYPWLIKRDSKGNRTHHIHMVEKDFPHWDRLYFRDYLREKTEVRYQYAELKREIAQMFPDDRVAYTGAKTGFINKITRRAKIFYGRPLEPMVKE